MKQNNKILNKRWRFIHENGRYLLYNPDLLISPDVDLLCCGIFQKADSYQPVTEGGRGQAWFIKINGLSAVYRKYMRGGLISKINQQTYFSLSQENTRSIKEWRLLESMAKRDLPVPRAIAASVSRWPFKYSPFYRAQILVELIPNVQVLDQILNKRELKSEEWTLIGECIRRFHDENVCHADLNANNILINELSTVYLIDFDKSEIRQSQNKLESWKLANLQRLKRSLLKQQSIHASYYFSEDNWQTLLAAYTG